jgi:integrase
MGKPRLKLVAPVTEFGAVQSGGPPRKRPNADVRSREYLTEAEVERLIKAAGDNRHALRDQTMIYIAFRHALRSIELTRLRWDSVDFDRAELHVARVKGSKSGTHQIGGRELRMLRKLRREQTPASVYVFTTERKTPFSTRGFRQMIERLGVAADFDFPVHAHMLRHATGYKLANDGQPTRTLADYLGHRNGVASQRRIAEAAYEGIFVIARRLLDDLERKLGERLVDHAPLLDPPRRDVDARGAVVHVQLIAVHAEQFRRAQHGRQRKLDREPRLAVPRHILAVEAMPQRPDLVFGQHAVARMLLVELVQMDAR